ncbi:trans-sialidase [Trypanosoma cruzi]|nr:trans-sialidase [Trypanosoma cruzi]
MFPMCCGRDVGSVRPASDVAFWVAGTCAVGFLLGSCNCRLITAAVDTSTVKPRAVRGDVRQRRSGCDGGTRIERRAAACRCFEGGRAFFASRWLFSCVGVARCVLTRGRSTRRDTCWWWQSLCVPGALLFLLLFRVSVRVSCCCWEWLRG